MTRHSASAHDQENPRTPSRGGHPGQMGLIKKDIKKPARKANTVPHTESSPNSPSAKDGLDARIMRRANELAHHPGGYDGQNLHDWLIAAREVLSQESW
ncbi:MAG: hypothetical protein E4H32_04265 [Nitrospirales bacterium]|nr:MAG: hypothetical protein E4H32_04265 [Nitrospirales bacterium]